MVGVDQTRRDFLLTASCAMGAFGVGALAAPLIRSMSPSADVLALSTVEVNLSSIQEGQASTVLWRGKPVFIRHRTRNEIREAKSTDLRDLVDPVSDEERFKINPEWLVVVGICTHLGCVPSGQRPSDNRGRFKGWFCPCHGSEYDISGRIRHGPAPRNLEVPPYRFLDDTVILIGAENV